MTLGFASNVRLVISYARDSSTDYQSKGADSDGADAPAMRLLRRHGEGTLATLEHSEYVGRVSGQSDKLFCVGLQSGS